MKQERVHRKYSPSQAERFFACHGSNNLLKRVPARPTTPYAQEGADAHAVLEAALNAHYRNARDAHKALPAPPALSREDQNDFYNAIQVALDYIHAIFEEHVDAKMWVERFVNPPLIAAPGEAGGYCDVAVFVPDLRTLFVIDYKHGVGIAKKAEDNYQLMQYAAGFLYEDNAVVNPRNVDAVVLTVIQPRAFHQDGVVREQYVTPHRIWEYLEDLEEVVSECEREDAALTPGEEQCRFCDARTLCPAREAMALQVADSNFTQIQEVKAPALPDIDNIAIQKLAQIRFHAPMLRRFLDDVDKHVEELIREGHSVPGAKLVQAQARRTYYGSDEDIARQLAAMLGERNVDLAINEYNKLLEQYPVLEKIFNQKLVTITSAEKLVIEAYKKRVGRKNKKQAAEEAKQAFAFLTLKKPSETLVVVNEDDPRPAVNRAENTFHQIAGAIPPPKSL